jgi:glycosyltransferase 2 family protein
MHRAVILLLAGLAFGALFLYLSVGAVSIEQVTILVRASSPRELALAVVCAVMFMALKTLRWRELMPSGARVDFARLHSIVYAGTAVNLILSHIGELFRAHTMNRVYGVATSAALATIALERLFDILAMLLLLVLFLVMSGNDIPDVLAAAARIGLVFSLAATAALIVALVWSEACARLVDRASRALPRRAGVWVNRQFTQWVAGLDVVRDPRVLLRVLALSTVQWSTIAAGIWLSAHAVGAYIEWPAALALLTLLIIGLSLPTAPVYVGTTQLAFTVGLHIFSVDAARAVAGSLIYTIFVVMPMFLVGAACIARLKTQEPVRSIAQALRPTPIR